jgi:hypothetical protein
MEANVSAVWGDRVLALPVPENLAQLSHFATLFPVPLSFGTTLERIAAESLTLP